MTNKNKYTDEVKVKLTPNEKEQLKAIADETNSTMSDLIRQAIFTDGKIVLLAEGGEIVKELFDIRMTLEDISKYDKLPDYSINALLDALNKVSEAIYTLSENLSDLHSSEEGDEE